MSNIHDDQIVKIDRLWLRVSLVAWLSATGWLVLTCWRQEPTWEVLFGVLPICLIWGSVLMLYFVGIPLRIVLNLIFKERRRQRLGETVMCFVAFLTITLVFVLAVRTYPPGW